MCSVHKSIILSLILLILLSTINSSCIRFVRNSDGSPGKLQQDPSSSSQALPQDVPKSVTGTISTGSKVEVLTTNINQSGGAIVVTKQGDPLDGLKIEIPSGAFSDVRTFKISYSPIQQHTFGANFNPLTPLMTIENGGGYASTPITMKIPVKIPQRAFAMAFFYDNATKKLEGLPLLDEDSNSITVATRHFSSLVVSYYLPDPQGTRVDSYFRPGRDDWQFANPSTYLAPFGTCTGMTLSAAWYYYEKRLNGAPSLHNLYDNNGNNPPTPKLWEDDCLALRLVSVLQDDFEKTMGLLYDSFLYAQKQHPDELTRLAFVYAMLLTGEPQMVAVHQQYRSGGHAMLVYKIDENGSLYVADPNYPGEGNRKIEFADGKYKPYKQEWKRMGIEESTTFSYVGYMAKSAFINWGQITTRWSEFDRRTIGKDLFPDYKLVAVVKDEDSSDYQMYHLTDGFITAYEDLAVYCDMPKYDWLLIVFGEPPNARSITHIRADHLDVLISRKWARPRSFKLKPGINVLGFHVSAKDNSGSRNWVDFKWVTVYLETLTLTPPKLDGITDQWYPFTARMDNTPSGAVYEWYRDDYLVEKEGNATGQFKFNREGTYKIGVKLRDKVTGRYIGEASAEAKITSAARTQPPPIPSISIEPLTPKGEPGKGYSFTATAVNPPDQTAYDWYIGDTLKGKDAGRSVTITFSSEGSHLVTVKLRDKATDKYLCEATVVAVITDKAAPISPPPPQPTPPTPPAPPDYQKLAECINKYLKAVYQEDLFNNCKNWSGEDKCYAYEIRILKPITYDPVNKVFRGSYESWRQFYSNIDKRLIWTCQGRNPDARYDIATAEKYCRELQQKGIIP